MAYWRTFQQNYLPYIPIFLLALSCGAGSGTLMTTSFLTHLIVCKKEGIPIMGTLWKKTVVWQTVLAIAIFFGTAAITIPFNGGNPAALFKYIERLVPLVLAVLMARPGKGTFPAVWLGISLSIIWRLGLVAAQPTWQDNRLFGPYTSPNALGSILLTLLPVVLFGVIRYRSLWPKTSFFLALVCITAFVVLLCTGSRNAYFAFFIVFLALLVFCYLGREWLALKVMACLLVLSCLVLGVAAPQFISDRLHRDISQDGRVYLTEVAVQLIEEKPYIGIGLGRWGKVYHERFEAQNPFHEKNIQSPHNIYLQTWNETGIVGLSGFLILILFQLKVFVSSLRAYYRKQGPGFPWLAGFFLPILAIYLFGLFDYDFFNRQTMHLYWFFWGMTIYSWAHYKKETNLL